MVDGAGFAFGHSKFEKPGDVVDKPQGTIRAGKRSERQSPYLRDDKPCAGTLQAVSTGLLSRQTRKLKDKQDVPVAAVDFLYLLTRLPEEQIWTDGRSKDGNDDGEAVS